MAEVELLITGLRMDYPEMVESALDSGCGVDDPIIGGQAPLLAAAFGNKAMVAELLVRRGANTELKFQDMTPLMVASQEGSTAVAEILLRAGANVDECSCEGLTSLMIAVRDNHVELVQLLLEHNANVQAKTNNGSTALDVAWMAKNKELYNLLEKHLKDVMGETEADDKNSSGYWGRMIREAAPRVERDPERFLKWPVQALIVAQDYMYGQSFRLHVPNEEQRKALMDLYREDAREKSVNVVDINCEGATYSHFLGDRFLDEATMTTDLNYPAFWTDQKTLVFVNNIQAIQGDAIPAIRSVCNPDNKREMEKKWVMILVVTPEEQEYAFKVLPDAPGNDFDLVEMGWKGNP